MKLHTHATASLITLLAAPGGSVAPSPARPAPATGPVCFAASARGPELFDLEPTGNGPITAKGKVELQPATSPFGLAVTEDGNVVYEATISIDGLPPPASLGPYSMYVVWLATPSLDKVRSLGKITNGQTISARVDWNKMMYIISAEASAQLERWKGPIVLLGRSRSARVQSIAGCPIFDTGNRAP